MDQSHSNILGKMGFISWLQATKNWKIIPLEITSVSFLTLKQDYFNTFEDLKTFYRQLAIYNMSHYIPSIYIMRYISVHHPIAHYSKQVLWYLEKTYNYNKGSNYKGCYKAVVLRRAFNKDKKKVEHWLKNKCVAKPTDFSFMKKYATTTKNVKTFQGLL